MNPFCSNITQFIIFSPQIIFKYPIQSVCEFSNPLKHFKRPKIQKNPFCSLPPSFLLLKYYPSLSTLITLYWTQLLKSNKNRNKIQLIINQFQFIHCWYSDCSDLQSNSKKICQKCSIWDSQKKTRPYTLSNLWGLFGFLRKFWIKYLIEKGLKTPLLRRSINHI